MVGQQFVCMVIKANKNGIMYLENFVMVDQIYWLLLMSLPEDWVCELRGRVGRVCHINSVGENENVKQGTED